MSNMLLPRPHLPLIKNPASPCPNGMVLVSFFVVFYFLFLFSRLLYIRLNYKFNPTKFDIAFDLILSNHNTHRDSHWLSHSLSTHRVSPHTYTARRPRRRSPARSRYCWSAPGRGRRRLRQPDCWRSYFRDA